MIAGGRIAFRVCGRVQGVGYRFYAARLARRLGLAGGVRNEADGTVRVEVNAEPAERLAELRRGLAEGPPAARVDAVEPVAATGDSMDLEF